MMQTIIRTALWLLALASLVVAAVWSYNDPSFRSVLALLLAISAILGLMVSSGGGNTSVKDLTVEEGGASIGSKTGGNMNIEGVKTKTDVTITHE